MTHYAMDTEHPIIIPIDEKNKLEGILHVPKNVKGIVLFAHGSGSSRLSVRNQAVAREMNEAKLATLLFDLLTPEEEQTDIDTLQYRFDIEFLAKRLGKATEWISHQLLTHELPIGYFGASTGGGAALAAAAKMVNLVKAIVSRGGRPDLAGTKLLLVAAPTLLIVGGNDAPVIQMNQEALEKLTCPKKLVIVPGASHLFEEPGTLSEVARLAIEWFLQYLI